MTTSDQLSTRFQPLLDHATDAAGVTGIIAEVREGNACWRGASGQEDVTTGRGRAPDERFRIGSLTKAFTAATILQLDAAEVLHIDDPIDRWLPDLAHANGNNGDKINIRQLLNHTSGLYNVGNSPAWLEMYHSPHGFAENGNRYRSPQWLGDMAVEQPPSFSPGEQFWYSNGNYYLAGLIIERATGRSYSDALSRHVLDPLGLHDTYLPGADELIVRGEHAHSYSRWMLTGFEDAPPEDVTEMSMSWAWAAGGLVSSLPDMAVFAAAMATGTLLATDQHRLMWTTVSVEGSGWIPELDIRYGLGIYEQTLACGCTVRGGGGGTFGSFTYAMSSADGQRTLVTNVNSDWEWISTFTALLEEEFCSTSLP